MHHYHMQMIQHTSIYIVLYIMLETAIHIEKKTLSNGTQNVNLVLYNKQHQDSRFILNVEKRDHATNLSLSNMSSSHLITPFHLPFVQRRW